MQTAIIFLEVTIAYIFLLTAWKYWKLTIRDAVRDELFDLRDAWRNHWVDAHKDLNDPYYGYIRNRINAYLRYTAQWRLLDTWHMAKNQNRINQVVCEYQARHNPEPPPPNEEILSVATDIRKKAIDALRTYMIVTSVLLSPIVLIATVVIAIKTFTWDMALSKAVVWIGEKTSIGNSRIVDNAVTVGDFNFA